MRLARWLLMSAAAWAGSAAGHAGLVASVPPDGASLAAPPVAIELRFTEPVRPLAVRLIGGSHPPLTLPAPQGAGEVFTLPVPAKLERGLYTISFRVISADSHPVGGSIVFAVGQPSPPPRVIGDSNGSGPPAWVTLVRALRDLSLLIAAGGALFVVGITGFPGERLLLLVSGTLALLACIASIGLQGARILGNSPSSLDAWRTGLSGSFGLSAGVAAAAAVLIAVAVTGPAGRTRTFLLLAGALGAIASLPLTGHAMTAKPGAVAVAALAAHGLAAAFWIGSLAALFAIMSTKPSTEAAVVSALERFSRWGMLAVAVLLAAGIIFALLQLASPAELLGSRYGWLIVGKAALLTLLIGLAMFNRFHWLPLLARGAPGAARRLRCSIAGEGGLVACVIGVTAVLVHTPPPRAPAAERGFTQKLAYKSDFAELSVRPARPGSNLIVVRFLDKEGLPFDPEEVLVEIGNHAAGVEAATRPIRRIAPGQYSREGIELAFPGVWSIEVQARLDRSDVATFRSEVPIR